MEQAIVHRGPDEGHIWTDGVCGLAHRRLRVIDLSAAAAQPMCNEDQSLWIVFNGEIYNFQPMREDLIRLGHRFTCHSDTEVLVHGFEQWGTGLFARLSGMFAIALWDQKARRLTIARDPLGKKPLFIARTKTGLAFGSELPVFKSVPGLQLSVSRNEFAQYMEFGYIPGSRTILREVDSLPPGHFATWDATGLSTQSFWSLPSSPAPPQMEQSDPVSIANHLETPLREAVASRLVSDVPLGCFLSGGVDSSLVAALAQQSLPRPLRTYTVGFSDSNLDEARHAARVARHLGTDHHELMIEAKSLLGEFVGILARLPEPLGDDSFVPTFAISRETKREVTVALSGDGGDELFGGYAKYRQFAQALKWRGPAPGLWKLVAGLPWPDRIGKSLDALSSPSVGALARWLSTLWKQVELPAILSHDSSPPDTDDFFSASWKKRADFQAIERFMLLDMETYLEGDILPKVDRASMAVGLEVRSPFLDHGLVAATLQWPGRADLGRESKAALKHMLAKYVPRELTDRPKHGFGIPIEEWYRGPLRNVLLEFTSPARTRQRGLLNAAEVSRYVNLHLSGKRNFARKLHAIVAFEIWADKFFGPNTTVA